MLIRDLKTSESPERVSAVVKLIWPSCQVVILDSGCQVRQDGLKALAKALTRNAVAKNIQVDGLTIIDITLLYHMHSSCQSNLVFTPFRNCL